MNYLNYLVLSALIVPAPAIAQGEGETTPNSPIRGELITVVATGTQVRLVDTGQSIGVIARAEIDAVQGPDLTRVLERLPGIHIARPGPLGTQTSLFVRGANYDQVLTILDGVRLADYASPGGNYDFGNLLAGNIERIDLLRGSNSVIWGSQAMGGVLSVTTREAHGAELSGEYGAYDTVYLTGTAGLSEESYAASLSAGYVDGDGFSAKSAGTEPDGFRQWVASGKARYAVGGGVTLRANGRYADGVLDLDQSGPDAPDTQDTREGTGRIGLDYAGDGFSLSGGYTYAAVRRHYESAFGPSTFKGHGQRAELFGHMELPAGLRLDFGADSEWSEAESSFDPKAKARLSSGHALLGWSTDAASIAAGVRIDDHSRFGAHWTLGANGSIALVDGWRLRASYGEGFKAPTLYQLYGYGGNVALRPETSTAFDAGIELGDRGGYRHFAVTLFRRDSRNLIDYVSPGGYFNTARARAEGVEAELTGELTEGLRGYASYSYTRSVNRQTGKDLARRPRHAFSTGVDWTTPLADLKLGADLRVLSGSFDDAGNFTRLDGFALVTVRASLPVTEQVELFGRIENLGNKQYQTVAGYGTYGRSAYAGLRARW